MTDTLTTVPEAPLLNAKQVAERLQVHILTVRRWTREGKLPSLRLGKYKGIRYRQEDVYAFMRDHERTVAKPKPRRQHRAKRGTT